MELLNNKKTVMYIVLAYMFSVTVRFIWIYQFSGFTNFMWHDQFMINTNDGYFWAEGARDLLAGFHQAGDSSPIDSATSQLTAFFAYILPFSFETIILYMPVFLSSLVVIPIILIAQSLKRVELGFVAALIAGIAWSYYNRTMVGYYDTDMLNIVFPVFLLWSLVLAFNSNKEKYLIFTALEIIVYRWWYPQSYSLEFAFFSLILLYALIYQRKNIYYYKLLTIMLFAMMGLPSLIRLVAVVFIYLLYKSKKIDSYIYYLLGFAFLSFLATGGFDPIWYQLKGYVFKDSVKIEGNKLPLHFFSVMQTVREAGKIPFDTFANRISGSVIVFVFSMIGYVFMVFKYRIMLLALPLLGLGFLAYIGGLRFTVYAVPVAAFGVSYLIFMFSDFIKEFFGKNRNYIYVKSVIVAILVAMILYPNIKHIISYKVPTVFSKQEVSILSKLKKIVTREDYIVSWWDYGFPLRYYVDAKTLADGAMHSGESNFPISYMLTNPELVAAKMARLDVEYTEKNIKIVEQEKNKKEDKKTKIQPNIAQMTLDYGFKDTNNFLASLKGDIKLPKKTRDIYFYLPFRMMGIFPTVARFSNLDLMSGNTIRRPFFYRTNRFREKNGILNLANGIFFNQKKGTIKVGNQEVGVKDFYITAYEKNGKLIKQKRVINKNANLSIIYMRSYRTILVLDNDMLNSLYIQLFVFDNYDKKIFEPVILTPNAKVYKLKI